MTMASNQDEGITAWRRQFYCDLPVAFLLWFLALSTALIIGGWCSVSTSGFGW